MFKLLLANLKMIFRDKQALFWTLVFPCVFIIIFGMFDFEQMGDTKYVLIDKADSEISRQFKEGLEKIEFLKLEKDITDIEDGRAKLKEGDIDFVIVLPEDFKIEMPKTVEALPENTIFPSSLPQEPPEVGIIKIYYDQSNISLNQVIFSVIEKFLSTMNLQAANAPTLFTYVSEGVQAKNIKYLDILMPGILGMAVMQAAMIGIASEITRYREQKLLKRLQATPLKVGNFLVAQVSSYLVINVIQVTLIMLLARFIYDVQVYGSYLLIYSLSLVGSLIFLNIGFAIAGYAKSTTAAESLAQIIGLPMMFFSGVFFSTETLPKIVAKAVEFLPLTPLIEALRKISINNAGLGDITSQLLLMGVWIVASFLIAWKTFKFQE